jgi:hypothetical protein
VLLHCFNMGEKNRSMPVEELDLIEFAQVALLCSSLAVELACKIVVTESLALPSVPCEVMELQSDIVVVSFGTPPVFVDVPATVVGSSTSLAVALELYATGIVESFEAKPPDLVALEVGPKGVALVCS